MNSRIPCEVIQDLLPLYVDGLVSDRTEEEVAAHLEECQGCAAAFAAMGGPAADDGPAEEGAPGSAADHDGKPARELDYLKKIRSSNRRRIAAAVCITLCVALLAAGWKALVYGAPTTDFVAGVMTPVEGDTVTVRGKLAEGQAYSRYVLRDTAEGSKEIVVYSCPASFFHRDRDFEITVPVSAPYVEFNGTWIRPDGTVLSMGKARRLFQMKNPYIGDMPANNDLAFALGLSEELGPYYNELQTAEEPYGWHFRFLEPVAGLCDSDLSLEENLAANPDLAAANGKMEKYAVVLLALVENCGEISWEFHTDDLGEIEDEMTAEQASQLLGRDVKSFGESEEQVLEMLKLLDL